VLASWDFRSDISEVSALCFWFISCTIGAIFDVNISWNWVWLGTVIDWLWDDDDELDVMVRDEGVVWLDAADRYDWTGWMKAPFPLLSN
jgi:hypothetical protein